MEIYDGLSECGITSLDFLLESYCSANLELNNRAVLDLVSIKEDRDASWSDCGIWLRRIYVDCWPRKDDIPKQTLSSAVNRLRGHLKKCSAGNKADLLKASFNVPIEKKHGVVSSDVNDSGVSKSDTVQARSSVGSESKGEGTVSEEGVRDKERRNVLYGKIRNLRKQFELR